MSDSIQDPPDSLTYFVGVDPGQDKCGLALVGAQGSLWQKRHLLQRQIVMAGDLRGSLGILLQQVPVTKIVLGDQTRSQHWQQQIEAMGTGIPVVLVDERYSSQEAHHRYWDDHSAQGWGRLLPRGMRTPPGPIDDIVAQILVERYLDGDVGDI